MNKWQVVLAGFFGGVAPNLIGGAQQLVRRAPDPSGVYMLADPWFLLGTVVIGLIGGALLYFVGEPDLRKAIALGAAAPALILGWAQGFPSNQPASPSAELPVSASQFLVATASRSPGTPIDAVVAQSGGPIVVHLQGVKDVGFSGLDLVAVLRGAAGPGRSARREVRYGLPARDTLLQIDGSANRVYVQLGNETSNTVELTPGTSQPVLLKVTLRATAAPGGFARAFGIRSAPARRLQLARVR
jgi:hypothetical protein